MEAIGAYVNEQTASRVLIGLTFAVIALAGLSTLLVTKKDPQEPPFMPSAIPFVGHIIHLFREGADYYTELYQQHHQGLYTIPFFGRRMYIVSSPEWIQAMHKAHKTLSFNTLVVPAMRKVFGFDEATMKIVGENKDDEKGDRSGVLLQTHDMIKKTMAPGVYLDELNKSFLHEIAPRINLLARNGAEKLKLWAWVRHHFSLASAAAIYGPENPFALDHSLEADFWAIEKNAGKFMILPFPSVLARKAWQTRQRMFDSMIEYAEQGRWKQASQLAKNRAEMNLDHGISTEMYGVGEVSMLFAVLANTVPSAFWILSNVFADAELLSDIRSEVDQCIRSEGEGNKRIINATKLRTQCPLLFSAMRETLRMVACMNINRYVREDTLLTNSITDETYKLKKGSLVQVAATVIHFIPEIYGEDVRTFNPRRFMPAGTEKTSDPAAPFRDESGKVHTGAFRTFGGGNNVCPGRHFAQTEMESFVALFVAGFEIASADGGQYVPPPLADVKMPIASGLIQPGRDVGVCVSRRKGYGDVQWDFEL